MIIIISIRGSLKMVDIPKNDPKLLEPHDFGPDFMKHLQLFPGILLVKTMVSGFDVPWNQSVEALVWFDLPWYCHQKFPLKIPMKNSHQKFPWTIPIKNSHEKIPWKNPMKNSLQPLHCFAPPYRFWLAPALRSFSFADSGTAAMAGGYGGAMAIEGGEDTGAASGAEGAEGGTWKMGHWGIEWG